MTVKPTGIRILDIHVLKHQGLTKRQRITFQEKDVSRRIGRIFIQITTMHVAPMTSIRRFGARMYPMSPMPLD